MFLAIHKAWIFSPKFVIICLYQKVLTIIISMKMKKYIAGGLAAGTVALMPLVALAQQFQYATTFLDTLKRLIDQATPIIIGLALLFFLYGLMVFILAAGDEEKSKKGKQIMIWGIVALFIMVSIWGIIRLLQTNTGVGTDTTIPIPKPPT